MSEEIDMPTAAELLASLSATVTTNQRLRDIIDYDVVAVQRLLVTGFVEGLSWMHEAGYVDEQECIRLLRRFREESEVP